jgi:3-oxoacyl-[acyl-carrier protein] reductase
MSSEDFMKGQSLQRKIALVTGAGRGIGKAIALAFAKEGAEVVVNDIKVENLEGTVRQIKALGGKVIALAADVADKHEVNEMVDKVIQALGGIDILVSNAGIGFPKMIKDISVEEWDKVFSINIGGLFNCTKAVIKTMKKRGGGKIVAIGSMASRRMSTNFGIHYTSSKAAILGFVRHLAHELGPFGINVNCVNPGLVFTSLIEKGNVTPEFLERQKQASPLRDIIKPEDIANAVVFLASDKARMITGFALDVDGGRSLGAPGVSYEAYVERRRKNN